MLRSSSTVRPRTGDRVLAVRMFDYPPGRDYLRLQPGHEVVILHVGQGDDDFWLYGESNGSRGWFPIHCVTTDVEAGSASVSTVETETASPLSTLSDGELQSAILLELQRRPHLVVFLLNSDLFSKMQMALNVCRCSSQEELAGLPPRPCVSRSDKHVQEQLVSAELTVSAAPGLFNPPFGLGTEEAESLAHEVVAILRQGRLEIGKIRTKNDIGRRWNQLFWRKSRVNNGSWKKWLLSIPGVALDFSNRRHPAIAFLENSDSDDAALAKAMKPSHVKGNTSLGGGQQEAKSMRADAQAIGQVLRANGGEMEGSELQSKFAFVRKKFLRKVFDITELGGGKFLVKERASEIRFADKRSSPTSSAACWLSGQADPWVSKDPCSKAAI